jgi:hypothetical protein
MLRPNRMSRVDRSSELRQNKNIIFFINVLPRPPSPSMSRLVFGYRYLLVILVLRLQSRRSSKKPGSLECRCCFFFTWDPNFWGIEIISLLVFLKVGGWVGASSISVYTVIWLIALAHLRGGKHIFLAHVNYCLPRRLLVEGREETAGCCLSLSQKHCGW